MNYRDIELMRKDLLERFCEDYKDAYIAAAVVEPDSEDGFTTVRVLYDELGDGDDEAFAEYYFTPLTSEDDTVQYFTGLFTLSDDLPTDDLSKLYEAMSYINFYIPAGAFSIDAGHRVLTYRLCSPMSIEASREEIYRQMNIIGGNSAAIADAYMGVLLDVANDEMTVDEVRNLLGME